MDFIITSRITNNAYDAETWSGVPRSDPYAVARSVDKGLVHLHCVDGGDPDVQVTRWRAGAGTFDRVISIRYDMDVLDRWDVLVSETRLRLVHTTTSNAGIFVGSDVYELPRRGSHPPALDHLPEACVPNQPVLAEVARALSSSVR